MDKLGETDYMRKDYTNIDMKYEPDNEDKFKDENMYKYHENT